MNKAKEIIKKVKEFFSKTFHIKKPGLLGKLKIKKLRPTKSAVLLVILAVVLGVLYYFKGLFVAALINGQPVSRFSVISRLEKQDGKSTLDSIVTETLIFQQGKKLNAIPSDNEIQAEVAKVREQVKNSGQDLNTLLAFQKMTLKDLEEQIKLQKTVEKILSDKVTVTPEEVAQYIADNKASIPADMKQADVEAAATQQIKSQKLGEEFQKWLEKVKATSDIKYLVKYE